MIQELKRRIHDDIAWNQERSQTSVYDRERAYHAEQVQKLLLVLETLDTIPEPTPPGPSPEKPMSLKEMIGYMGKRPGITTPGMVPRMPTKEEAALALACHLMDTGSGDWDEETVTRRKKWRRELEKVREKEFRIATSIKATMHLKVREYHKMYGVSIGNHNRVV